MKPTQKDPIMSIVKNPLIWIIVILVLTCISLVYNQLDTAVTLNHQQQEMSYLRNKNNLLGKIVILALSGKRKEELSPLFKNQFDENHIIKEEFHSITVDDIVFIFESGKLKSINDINE